MLMDMKRVRDSFTSCLSSLTAIQQYAGRDNTLLKMCKTVGPDGLKEDLPVLLWSGVIFMDHWSQTHKDPHGILSAIAALELQSLEFNFLKISGIQSFS